MRQTNNTLMESPVIRASPLHKRRRMHTPVRFSRKAPGIPPELDFRQHNQESRKTLFDTPDSNRSKENNRNFWNVDDSPEAYEDSKHESNVNPFCMLNEPSFNSSMASSSKVLDSSADRTANFSSPAMSKYHKSQNDSVSSMMLLEESPVPKGSGRKVESPTSLCRKLKRTCSIGMDEDDPPKFTGDILIDEDSDNETPIRRKRESRYRQRVSKTPQPPPLAPVTARKLGNRRRTFGGATSADRKQNKFSRFDEEFVQLGVLGGGSFGTVYKCKNRLDGCLYAVKVTKQQFKGKADRERVLKEVYALSALCNSEENPNIVRYFSAFVEDGRLYIQTELCDMSLEDIMKQRIVDFGGIEFVAKTMARQVLEGLARLHKHNLVHLDIKPANIFIKNGVYKVGDLGHACLSGLQSKTATSSPTLMSPSTSPLVSMSTSGPDRDGFCLPAPPPINGSQMTPVKPPGSPSPAPTPLNDSDFDMDILDRSSGFVDIEEGDSRYMAPEILNEDYTNLAKGDIFSLGATLYEICLGHELPANGPAWHNIRHGKLSESALRKFSPPMQELVRLLLVRDPIRRPSAQTLLTSGGPAGILRTEYEKRLAREKAAADNYRKQLARMKSSVQAQASSSNVFELNERFRMRRSNTM